MKRNVDLTENEDFKKGLNFQNLGLLISKSLDNSAYPWDFNGRMGSAFGDGHNELFFTGNKEQIKNKKNSDEYSEGVECECCGRDLSKKRWNNYYRLCSECDDRIYVNNNEETRNKLWLKVLR